MNLRDQIALRILPIAIEHWKNCDAAEEGGGLFTWEDCRDNKDTYSYDCLNAAENAYHMADAMLSARSNVDCALEGKA